MALALGREANEWQDSDHTKTRIDELERAEWGMDTVQAMRNLASAIRFNIAGCSQEHQLECAATVEFMANRYQMEMTDTVKDRTLSRMASIATPEQI